MNRMPLALLASACIMLLSACSLQSVALRDEPGYPPEFGVTDPFSGIPVAVWSRDRAEIAVVAFGSSTCMPIPTEIRALDDNEVRIVFESPSGACTDDVSSTTYSFTTPEEVETTSAVTATIMVDDVPFTVPVMDQTR